jgi:hypothetical protein
MRQQQAAVIDSLHLPLLTSTHLVSCSLFPAGVLQQQAATMDAEYMAAGTGLTGSPLHLNAQHCATCGLTQLTHATNFAGYLPHFCSFYRRVAAAGCSDELSVWSLD